MRHPRSPLAALLLALAASFLMAEGAAANDSSATLGAGGLRLTERYDIEMVSEDLFLSRTEVRVAYEYRNTGGEDVTTLVAFPLPELGMFLLTEGNADLGQGSDPDFLGFTVTSNGEPVTPEVDVRALVNGVDVTDLLREAKVPLDRDVDAILSALKALPPPLRARLEALDVASFHGQGKEMIVAPHWVLRTIFYWRQVFPAEGITTIEHRYRPVVGAFLISRETLESEELRPFCPDEAFRRAVVEQMEEGGSDVAFARQLDYVLTTARNWSGPIGSFHLTIDKGGPETLLSLCMEGLEKTGPTRFEMRRENFEPEADLKLLFVEPSP